MSASATIITKPTVTLTDRIRIQRERIQKHEYVRIGRLTSVLWEGQRSTAGFSQEHSFPGLDVFGKWKRKIWCSLTLDWLTHSNAPILAISLDRHDLLLPFRLPALPDIPDPRFSGHKVALPADAKNSNVPRIPQLLAGCPIVGDRASGRITDRISGTTFLIFRPLTELQVMCGKGQESGFGRIRCGLDPAENTHAALLVNAEPDSQGTMEAYFVGGSFFPG